MKKRSKKNITALLTVSLILAGGSMNNVFATDLQLHNEAGAAKLKNDNGIYKFLDDNNNAYDTITHTKEEAISNYMFMMASNKSVDVLTNKLDVTSVDHTADIIYASNSTVNIGTEENSINEVNISGNVTSRPGMITATTNGKINFWVNNMQIESDPTLNIESHLPPNGPRIVFAIDKGSTNGKINVNANGKIKIIGNISAGYLKNHFTGAWAYTTDGQININNIASGTVQMEGDIYTANIESGGTEYRDNNIDIMMQDANSYLKGSVEDYYAGGVTHDKGRREGTHLSLTNGSKWDMTASSYVTDLSLGENSLVNLNYSDASVPKTNYRVLRIYNDLKGNSVTGNGGTFNLDIDADTNIDNSDRIYITGTHVGTHYITLNNVGTSTDNATGTVLVSVADEQGNFKANDNEGALYWNKYELVKKTDDVTNGYTADWILNSAGKTPDQMTTGVDAILSTNALNYHTWRTENDKLLQRMGELRLNGADSDGIWARIKGSKISRNGTYDFENKYKTYELGYDKEVSRNEDRTRYVGAAFTYTDGTSRYRRGSGDNSSRSLSVYATDIGNKGHYWDLVFKVSNMDNDFKVYDTHSNKITGDFNNTGIALSAEYGRKSNLKNGWYIEPQGQLTIGRLRGDDYTTSNGIHVAQDSINSVVARVGFNIGKEIGTTGIVYAKANVLHEFGGDYDVSMRAGNDRLNKSDSFDDTWFEYGIGAAFRTSSDSSIYLDLERSTGSDYRKDWQWNVGARWMF